MNNSDEYIEAYFRNTLSDIEKKQFEERCVEDETFAREVALYITVSEGIRQKLLDQKKQQWNDDEGVKNNKNTAGKKITFRMWFPYAAAACILIAVMLIFIPGTETPHRLANEYVSSHFTYLSQTMGSSKDSLQQGIAAYNNKDYNNALHLFEKIYQSHPENGNAKKYVGLVYLITKNYDKALQHFEELANRSDLYGNPGLFLKAATLLERNKQEDKAQAKQLLERVVSENGEGSREAKKWLEKW